MQKPPSDSTSTAIAFGKPYCPTIPNVQGSPRCNWSSSTFNGTCVSLKASSTIHVILTQLCLGGRFFSCCSLRSLRQTSPGWNPGGSSKLMQLARNRSTHVSPCRVHPARDPQTVRILALGVRICQNLAGHIRRIDHRKGQGTSKSSKPFATCQ